MKHAAINASPLIVLGRAGYLGLLPELFSAVYLPRAVLVEIDAGPAADTLKVTIFHQIGRAKITGVAGRVTVERRRQIGRRIVAMFRLPL